MSIDKILLYGIIYFIGDIIVSLLVITYMEEKTERDVHSPSSSMLLYISGFLWPITILVLLYLCRNFFKKGNVIIQMNPFQKGYPPTLERKYWEIPSDMIGREFDSPLGVFRVIGWEPNGGPDCSYDDGIMTFELIKPLTKRNLVL